METGVVVGGGLPGIVSALTLSKHFEKVVLIEKETVLGGALRKKVADGGEKFESGPCVIEPFQSPELNELLLKPSWKEGWNKIAPPLSGHFFDGKLFDNSPYLNCLKLPRKTYCRAVGEMISSINDEGATKNLEQLLTQRFGETLTQTLFAPILSKIFNGTPIWELDKVAADLFPFQKVVAFDPKTTAELSRSTFYKEKLSPGARGSTEVAYYPKFGGIYSWIQALEEELQTQGVEILTGERVKRASQEGELIIELETDSGKKLYPTWLIWTEDPGDLLEAAPCSKAPIRGKTHQAAMVNFTFDTPPCTDLHWLWCFDPRFLSVKATFLSNLDEEGCAQSGSYPMQVTLSADHVGKEKQFLKTAKEELIKMGVVDPIAKVLKEQVVHFPTPFAIPTIDLISSMQENAKQVASRWKNVISGGHLNGFESSPQKAAEHLYSILEKHLKGKRGLEEIQIPI